MPAWAHDLRDAGAHLPRADDPDRLDVQSHDF